MIQVHPLIYRLLWIGVAVLGALLLLGPLLLLSDDVTATSESAQYVLVASGGLGALTFFYALRRLIWPLKPPAQAR